MKKFEVMLADMTLKTVEGEELSANLVQWVDDKGDVFAVHVPSSLLIFEFPRESTLEERQFRCQEVEKLDFNWETTKAEDFNPKELPTSKDSFLFRIFRGEMTAAEAVIEMITRE